MRRQEVIIGAMASLLMAAGCKRAEEERYGEAPGAAPAAEQPGGAMVPPVLERAEELTEDIQDSINANKWDAAQRMTTQLQSAATELRTVHAKPKEVAMFDSAIAALSANVKAKNRIAADTSANRASFAVITMMSSYRPRIPVSVGYMDVAARDAMYKAELGDWKGVSHAISELDKNYASVASHVQNRNPQLDTSFRAHLDALKKAAKSKDANAVKQASQVILDEVDKIEQTF